MEEISREDAIKVLSTYNCVDCGCGSSQVPTTQCKWDCNYKYSVIKAISDMKKLNRIDNTRPIDLIKEFGDLDDDKLNKISHWFSQAQKFEKIEQLFEDWNNEAVKESRAFGYMVEIEQILKGE